MKLSKLIQALIDSQDISVAELSRRADVNRPYIYRRLAEDGNLDRMFDVLTGDVEPEEFVQALNLLRRIKINQQIL